MGSIPGFRASGCLCPGRRGILVGCFRRCLCIRDSKAFSVCIGDRCLETGYSILGQRIGDFLSILGYKGSLAEKYAAHWIAVDSAFAKGMAFHAVDGSVHSWDSGRLITSGKKNKTLYLHHLRSDETD